MFVTIGKSRVRSSAKLPPQHWKQLDQPFRHHLHRQRSQDQPHQPRHHVDAGFSQQPRNRLGSGKSQRRGPRDDQAVAHQPCELGKGFGLFSLNHRGGQGGRPGQQRDVQRHHGDAGAWGGGAMRAVAARCARPGAGTGRGAGVRARQRLLGQHRIGLGLLDLDDGGLGSAGSAFSMARDEVSSSMPPPIWKLASEMPKKSRIRKPSSALIAITQNALNDAIQMCACVPVCCSPGCSG